MIVLITDPRQNDDALQKIVSEACRAIPAGKFAVLFRDHTRDDFGVIDIATKLCNITREAGQFFLVKENHWRVAFDVGASGVHASTKNPEGKTYREGASPSVIVSMPAHSDADVTHALKNEISWVLVSPIFATPGKGEPRGLAAIRNAAEITANSEMPKIIALGGVDASNAAECLRAGAKGVAVIRAILDAADPHDAARALWLAIAPFV